MCIILNRFIKYISKNGNKVFERIQMSMNFYKTTVLFNHHFYSYSLFPFINMITNISTILTSNHIFLSRREKSSIPKLFSVLYSIFNVVISNHLLYHSLYKS